MVALQQEAYVGLLRFGQEQLVLVHVKPVCTEQQEGGCCSTEQAVDESMHLRLYFAHFERDYREGVEGSWVHSVELVPEQEEEEEEEDMTELESEGEDMNEMGFAEEDRIELDSEEEGGRVAMESEEEDRTEAELEGEGTYEMGFEGEDRTEVDSEESTCKMDSAEEDKNETGSAEVLPLRVRELSTPERMSTRSAQAVVDQEGVDNTALVRLYSDTVMQEEAPFGTHTELAAGGSRLHMDIGRCLRMSALAGHRSVSVEWEEE